MSDLDSQWQGAELGDIARSQLRAHIGTNLNRLEIRGEPVTLPPDLATPFGLVLHELGTNATKFGALSVEHGHVAVSWEIIGGNPGHLRLVWQESGGPLVTQRRRRGFGSSLIESGLVGARVDHKFAPEGVICTIELELPGTGHHGYSE